MSFTGIIVASVNDFTKGALDKNGKQPVILNVVAGKFPNRNVISGTVAENIGIEVGHTYLFSITEGEPNSYGRQFGYNKLKEVSALEIVETVKSLGKAEMFKVEETSESPAATAQRTTEFSK